jgi:hypothetical protein
MVLMMSGGTNMMARDGERKRLSDAHTKAAMKAAKVGKHYMP